MSESKLVIWDFDGVLCDSLVECVTVAKLAAVRIEQPDLIVTQRNLHHICRPEVIMALYGQLRPLRAFVEKGQDYLWQNFNLGLFQDTPANLKQYK